LLRIQLIVLVVLSHDLHLRLGVGRAKALILSRWVYVMQPDLRLFS